LFFYIGLRYTSRTNTYIMNFLTPNLVVDNYILWFYHDEDEREVMVETIERVNYIKLSNEELSSDDVRIKNNIHNVLLWIDDQNFPIVEHVNMILGVYSYFKEDHVDGLDSIGQYS